MKIYKWDKILFYTSEDTGIKPHPYVDAMVNMCTKANINDTEFFINIFAF